MFSIPLLQFLSPGTPLESMMFQRMAGTEHRDMQEKSVSMSRLLATLRSSMTPEHPAGDKQNKTTKKSRQNKAELRWNLIEQDRKRSVRETFHHGGALGPAVPGVALLPSQA